MVRSEKTYCGPLMIAKMNINRWVYDRRVHIILLITVLLIEKRLQPYVNYCLAEGRKCTWCILPVLFSGSTISVGSTKLLFHVGMLLLLCDAPFFYPVTPYAIIRGGRKKWWMGECLYIIIAAFVYMSFITLISIFMLLPCISFYDGWDGVVADFHFGYAGKSGIDYAAVYHPILPAKGIVRYLYPSGTQLYTFLSGWASFSVLGLLLYLVSLKKNRLGLGLCISGLLVFLDPVLAWICYPYRYWLMAFSPVSWCGADYLNLINPSYFLNTEYTVVGYILLLTVLCVLIRIGSMHMDIVLERGGNSN